MELIAKFYHFECVTVVRLLVTSDVRFIDSSENISEPRALLTVYCIPGLSVASIAKEICEDSVFPCDLNYYRLQRGQSVSMRSFSAVSGVSF